MAGEWITKANWEALNNRWLEMQESIAALKRELKEKGDVLRYAEAMEQDRDRLQAELDSIEVGDRLMDTMETDKHEAEMDRERLEGESKEWETNLNLLHSHNVELGSKLERLREALSWYVDADNWKGNPGYTPAHNDHGHIAQQALAREALAVDREIKINPVSPERVKEIAERARRMRQKT